MRSDICERATCAVSCAPGRGCRAPRPPTGASGACARGTSQEVGGGAGGGSPPGEEPGSGGRGSSLPKGMDRCCFCLRVLLLVWPSPRQSSVESPLLHRHCYIAIATTAGAVHVAVGIAKQDTDKVLLRIRYVAGVTHHADITVATSLNCCACGCTYCCRYIAEHLLYMSFPGRHNAHSDAC